MQIMSRLKIFTSDILKAATMQISIWRWEAVMISKFGRDWGYKPTYEKTRKGSMEEHDF